MMRTLGAALVSIAFLTLPASAQRFYPDDPLFEEPTPRRLENAASRDLSDYYDFFSNLFAKPGEQISEVGPVPAQAVNTLGEPMVGAWYAQRHYYNRMSIEELQRGAGTGTPPSDDGLWTITAAKSDGVTPGFMIRDSNGEVFVVKFDPLDYPELATGADMISSRIFYAAGYHVPEYYIINFDEDRIVLGDDVELRDALGQRRKMTRRDVIELLIDAPRDSDGRWRGIASRYLSGKPLGPFRYEGTRSDDPNDVVPHENRRDLRGLSVLCAWVNHDDSRSINTLDMLVEEDGLQYVKHHLIDFGSTLGSASSAPNTPRNGHEYIFNRGTALKQFFTLGIWVPNWAKQHFPGIRSVGNFEAEVFDPARWVPEYPNPAFTNRLPDDAFWGAKQVMAFTDEEIRAIVQVAEYSDPRATRYIADTLIARRDKIGRHFFSQVLPLDRFRVEDGELVFNDLAVDYRFADGRDYTVQWSNFDNQAETKTPISSASSLAIPAAGEGGYLAADIHGGDPNKSVTVYLRRNATGFEVVGIDRKW